MTKALTYLALLYAFEKLNYYISNKGQLLNISWSDSSPSLFSSILLLKSICDVKCLEQFPPLRHFLSAVSTITLQMCCIPSLQHVQDFVCTNEHQSFLSFISQSLKSISLIDQRYSSQLHESLFQILNLYAYEWLTFSKQSSGSCSQKHNLFFKWIPEIWRTYMNFNPSPDPLSGINREWIVQIFDVLFLSLDSGGIREGIKYDFIFYVI